MRTKTAYLLLILLSLALFLPGIGSIPMVDRDSAHFAQASKQMLETGNFFQIRYQNQTRYQKPPGINWLQAASVDAFSSAQTTNAWPYRLPSLLGGLFAVLLTFAMAKRFYSREVAFAGAALLASSLLMTVESHLAVIDASLLASILVMQAALWGIYRRHCQQREVGWLLPVVFWLAMSAGIVLKGTSPLVGLLTLAALAIFDKDKSFIKQVRPFTGILLLAISSSWLLLINHAENSNYLWQMIQKDLLPKLAGSDQGHGMPPGYFLLILSLTFWPASLFLWHGVSWAWKHRHRVNERFLIAWIVPTWLFFELMPSKLPQYVLPVYPALAILVANAILDPKKVVLQTKYPRLLRALYLAWGVFSVGLGLAYCLIPYLAFKQLYLSSVFAGLVTIGLSITALVFAYKEQLKQAAITVIIMAVFSYAAIYQFLLPSIKPLWISQHIAHEIKQLAPQTINKNTPLLAVGYAEPSLVFQLGTYNVRFSNPTTAIKQMAQHPQQLVLIAKPYQHQFLQLSAAQHLSMRPLTEFRGFNYSKGQWVDLTLYQQTVT